MSYDSCETANSGGLYPGLPAAPLALDACASIVKPVVGSLLCTAVPRGVAAVALLPVPLWPLVELRKTEERKHGIISPGDISSIEA